MNERTSSGPSGLAIGGILVVIGAILLVGQLLDIGLSDSCSSRGSSASAAGAWTSRSGCCRASSSPSAW